MGGLGTYRHGGEDEGKAGDDGDHAHEEAVDPGIDGVVHVVGGHEHEGAPAVLGPPIIQVLGSEDAGH